MEIIFVITHLVMLTCLTGVLTVFFSLAGSEKQKITSAAQERLSGTLVNKDQIEGAKAMVARHQDIKRDKNLIEAAATTGSDLDLVQSRYEAAISDHQEARNIQKTSSAKIRVLRSRRALIWADLKRKTAELERAHCSLSYTTIRAPYTGKFGRKSFLAGQQIQTRQPLVFIVNEQDKCLRANLKEDRIYRMYVMQWVDIKVDAIGDKVYLGRIEAIAASTD